MSFALQMLREELRGTRFPSLFLRRQLGLLAIGVAHALTLSAEDILVFYAVMGFALLLFRGSSPRTILTWTILLYLFSFVPAEIAAIHALGSSPPAVVAESNVDASQVIKTYRDGTFRDITVQRIKDYLARNPATVPMEYPRKFAFFLLGLLIVRHGVFHAVASHRRLFVRAAMGGLLIGLLGRAALLLCYLSTAPAWTRALRLPLAAVANPALSLFYGATVVLLFHHPLFRRYFRPLAAVGRMALTNYALQSLICTTIFYAYGLALYGALGPLPLLGLSVLIFAVQVCLSAWWMSRFRLGPLEWLWRSFSYGALQPMRTPAGPGPAHGRPRTNCPP